MHPTLFSPGGRYGFLPDLLVLFFRTRNPAWEEGGSGYAREATMQMAKRLGASLRTRTRT